MLYDVIIIGSGPAGYTAAIYTVRAGLKTLVLEGEEYGGQLMTTTEVFNFPGFANGISGPDLMDNLRQQCINLGCELKPETVLKVNLQTYPYVVEQYSSKTVIIATGATAKKLSLPNGDTFWNKGISACAVCDGALPRFRNKRLVVVGGGDTACEEALFLSKFASEVFMLVRSDNMRASHMMKSKVLSNAKISVIYNTEIDNVDGHTNLETIYMTNTKTGEEFIVEVAGLFYAIGHTPNTKFLNCVLDTTPDGYVITNNTKTNIPGIFACGDVQDNIYRQAITAAGSGCMAALEAEKYLTE